MAHMVTIVVIVATITKFISGLLIASVFAMMKNNTELRYERLLREFEELEKKLQRKVKQIIEVRAKLGINEKPNL